MEKSQGKEEKQSRNQIIRQSFRLPIGNCTDISLKIDAQTYEIVNIGNKGIAFYTTEKQCKFNNKATIDKVNLQLCGSTIQLQGQIVHITPSGSQEICGMKFVGIDQESQETLNTYIENTMSSLFEK